MSSDVESGPPLGMRLKLSISLGSMSSCLDMDSPLAWMMVKCIPGALVADDDDDAEANRAAWFEIVDQHSINNGAENRIECQF